MYIEEFENVEVVLTHYSQPSKWEKSIGYKPEINNPFNVHWSLLKSKRDYRIKFIKVKCDDCKTIFKRRIRDLDPNNNYHLCKHCVTKGERNKRFGKPQSEKQILALEKWRNENSCSFTWDSVKEKIKEKKGWLKMAEKRIGFKHSEITKNKMSLSAIEAFKEGRRKPSSGWGNIKIKQYKGIDYQSSYELKFLKYLDSLDKLSLIERGPRITYIDNNGNEHNYYIDYKIKNTDVVFEIKSDYLWDKKKEINELKKLEAEKQFKYNLIINNNFKTIEKIFENYG